LGGNLFLYPFWGNLVLELQKYSFEICFYFDYRLFLNQLENVIQLIDLGYNINILIGDIEYLGKVIFPVSMTNTKFIFSVECIDDFFRISEFIERNNLTNAQIVPYYNEMNEYFFKSHVYLTEEDILSSELSTKNIFTNKVMNYNYFGKLILFHDKRIYANINKKPIGNINDSIKNIVLNEIKNGGIWRETRETVEPCKGCLFKYLCPPPSNYELAIGKPNLCHVKP
jgi:pseudo-rSAM protein